MREQIFEYKWQVPDTGSLFKFERNITHAIGNSDQYPFDIGENGIQNETIDAVVNAIEATPSFKMQRRLMVDVTSLVNAIRDLPGDLTQADVISTIANLQEEVHDIKPVSDGGSL